MTGYQNSARGGKGRVYVIGCDVGCKIGWTSKDPRSRVRALQTGNPYPLHLVGSVPGTTQLEASAHERFADYRMAGEWFDVNPYDALTWLMYEGASSPKSMHRELRRPFQPAGSVHGMLAALDVYGHGRDSVWTMDGINAVMGRWPTDEEMDAGHLFRARVTVGGRNVVLYSLEPFEGETVDELDPEIVFGIDA